MPSIVMPHWMFGIALCLFAATSALSSASATSSFDADSSWQQLVQYKIGYLSVGEASEEQDEEQKRREFSPFSCMNSLASMPCDVRVLLSPHRAGRDDGPTTPALSQVHVRGPPRC